MKKVIFYLLVLGATFTSCDPMDEIYDNIDEQGGIEGVDYISGSLDYTLSEDDYALVAAEIDSVEYFASQDMADLAIPTILSSTHPALGKGSLINATYDLYNPSVLESVTATEALANIYDIDNYLSSNYEVASNGTFVELTYDSEVEVYTLTDDDFETIGGSLSSEYPSQAENAASYGNFDRREGYTNYWSDNMILEGLKALFEDEYTIGEVISVSFAIYDGGTNYSETFIVQYNGFGFVDLEDVVLQIAPSLGTEYTFTGDDYDTVGTTFSVTYPDPASSVGNYSNFERREGNDAYWSDDMLLEAVNAVLPVVSEGDVYVVTFDIYNGASGTETLTLEYTSGVYVLSDLVAEATVVEIETIVGKNSGEWEFPYIFTDADYELLGQSYGNFDSGSIYKLEIFLESLYPYAQSGDVASVQYEYYDGSTNEKYGMAIFDGSNWSLPADVIATTFQYGFEDGEWIPDNTITYTLLNADYEYIATALAGNADYDGLLTALSDYHDYDYNWTSEQILYSLIVFADHIAPSPEEGQKYLFTYLVYDNGLNVLNTKLIYTDGAWVEVAN